MFEDWKQAWRQAVENFQRELDDDRGDDATRAMRRDERTTADALRRLDSELATARKNAATERNAEAVCLRREGLARNIGDTETADIAAEYATRHAERATILERKADVLEAERAMLVRDLDRMRAALAARKPDPQVAPGGTDAGPADTSGDDPAGSRPGAGVADSGPTTRAEARQTERERDEHNFRKMEREARERAAEARLEELKRKLR